ncbi:MAG: hypothetical protein M3O03_06500, partial [Pseudomonadota bacterium]|nr:hypothetical protein [Pseudomonadota bacterium]
ETWQGRETASFGLLPSTTRLVPGDVVSISGNSWRINTVKSGTQRNVEAQAYDAAVYDPPPAPQRNVTAMIPTIYGAPQVFMMDLAMMDSGGSSAPRIAANATPWPGSLSVFKRNGVSSFVYNSQVTQQATLGSTLTALAAGVTDRIDFNQTLDIAISTGSLSSVGKDELLAGSNIAVIGDMAAGFEIIQFQNALLISANTYRLSGLLRAQAGSDVEMQTNRAAGATFVLLNGAITQPVMSLAQVGQGAEWRIGPTPLDYGSPAYADLVVGGSLKATRPLSPTYFKMVGTGTGFAFSWIRRARINGDSWEMAEVPLAEDTESYQLQILNGTTVVRSVTTSAPTYFYSASDALADFGAAPVSISAQVCQLSASFGPGALIERTFNV